MPNDPSLWEIQRIVERNHAETRDDIVDLKAQVTRDTAQLAAQLERFVLREVYEAREAAMLQRINVLEESAKASRSAVRGALYAAVGSVIATILATVILGVIFKGGKP